jgi:hypothetical protein
MKPRVTQAAIAHILTEMTPATLPAPVPIVVEREAKKVRPRGGLRQQLLKTLVMNSDQITAILQCLAQLAPSPAPVAQHTFRPVTRPPGTTALL